jgi:Domain of unknown function (DUF6431)
MLVIHAGNTVNAYAEGYAEVATRRPEWCPLCEAVGQMIGHGTYPRKPLDTTPDPPWLLKIRRWMCRACKHTTSLLPDVLHRYRHYVWAVIAAVLLRRLLLGQTWVQIQAELSAMPAGAPPAPSLDSLMRWSKAFAGHAVRWLQRVLVVLASVRPELSQLDVHGRPLLAPPQQLLQVIGLLAGWLLPARASAAAVTTLADLRAVWRWGWNDGLGRLI